MIKQQKTEINERRAVFRVCYVCQNRSLETREVGKQVNINIWAFRSHYVETINTLFHCLDELLSFLTAE